MRLKIAVKTIVLAGITTTLYCGPLSSQQANQYEVAKYHYNQGDYSQAYTILDTLYQNALDDTSLNFLYGKSAYEIKEYPAALAAFERISFIEPHNKNNQIELARTQYRMGLFDEAKSNFQEVKEGQLATSQTIQTIDYYLNAITVQQKKHLFELSAKGGFLYDTHANLSSMDELFYSPTTSSLTAINDGAHEEKFLLVHRYDMGRPKGALFKQRVSYHNRSYFEHHGYDLGIFDYAPSLHYIQNNSTVALNGSFTHSTLGLESYYSNYTLSPQWDYSYNSRLQHSLIYSYEERNYFDNKTLNHYRHNFKGAISYTPSTQNALYAVLSTTHQHGEDQTQPNTSFDDYGITTLYTHQLLPRSIVQLEGEFHQRDFHQPQSVIAQKREDQIVNLTAHAIQKLNNALSLQVTYTYTGSNSTQSPNDYHQHQYLLHLSGRL
jgi:tetratricopeptide (TPR) repeat protein